MTGRLSLLGASAMALALASPVTAQQATPAAEPARDTAAAGPTTASPASPETTAATGVEEIVVTAQFRQQNLQRTPIAITAISGDMLQARSETNVQQIAGQAPSVNLQPGSATFGPSLAATIRGVGQYDNSPAVEPGVGIYVDDVYYASLTGSIFDLLDLDRIEVLRGPQGTLAGRNSIGGAIKLYSKRPTGSGHGFIEATYGSRNRIDLRGGLDFHIAPDLDARISGVEKRQRGYVTDYDFGCVNPPGSANNPAVGGVQPTKPVGSNCRLAHDGDVDYQAVRGQLRYHPSDAVDINLIGDYTHDSRNPPASVLTYANNPATGAIRGPAYNVPFDSRFICGKYCNYATGVANADPANGVAYGTTATPHSFYQGYGFSAEGEFKLSDDIKLTSITAYRHFTSAYPNDDDESPLPLSNSFSGFRFRFFSQEVRLNGSFFNDRLLYTVGGYYSSQKTSAPTTQDIRWAGLQFASLGDDVPAHSYAGFANITLNITDKLTFNGGFRYTHEDKDYTFSRRNVDGTLGQPLVGPLDGLTGSYRRSRPDYRANLQYQWSPELMTYAQFSTGFKGGGINPRPYFPSQVQPFGPETIKAYEVGLKSDLFDRKVRLNVSAFYNQYDNIQLVLLSCPQFNPPGVPPFVILPCSATQNAGDAHIKGAEAELSIRPVQGFLIDGSLSYVHFNYTSISAAAGGIGGVQLSDVAPFSSKWKWSIGAQYAVPVGNGATVTPRVDAAYQSSFYTGAVNAATGRVPGYTLVNARLTWRNASKDLEISAEATNLFNKYHLLNVFDLAAGGGYAVGEPGRPREWALTVSKHF